MENERHRLIQKYEKDSSFKSEIDKNFQRYHKLSQQAHHSNLKLIPQNILQTYPGQQTDLFFYYGFMQPTHKQNFSKLILFFMKTFNPKPHRPYIFVFFNNLTQSNAIYNEFRQIFLYLTIDHFVFLKQFIVIKSGFMHRAFDYFTFGALNKHLKAKTVFLDNSKSLCKYLKIDPFQFLEFIPEGLFEDQKSQFPKYEKQTIILQNHRENIIGQSMNRQQKEDRRKFENQMTSLMVKSPGKQTHQISDYEQSPLGIPLVLQLLIHYFKNDPSGLLQEGIFRKSVSIDQQNETLAELSRNNYDCLQKITNPHIIANLIKRFFSNLKTPVIPFKQFQQLMHDQGVSDKIKHVKDVIESLAPVNFLSLTFLIQFLKNQVIPKESSNKMTTQNISICFSPCILRAQKASPADLIYASKTVIYVKIMINQFDQVFGDQQKIKKLYRRSYMQKKQSLDQTIDLIIQESPKKRESSQGGQRGQLQVPSNIKDIRDKSISNKSNKSNNSNNSSNRPKIFKNSSEKKIVFTYTNSEEKTKNNDDRKNLVKLQDDSEIQSQKQLEVSIPQSNIHVQPMTNLNTKVKFKSQIVTKPIGQTQHRKDSTDFHQ